MGYDSRDIKDVRFGSVQAKALYLGSFLIWPHESPIPTGYTRLEYVKTDDTAYLDVGDPITNLHFGFEIDCAIEKPQTISGSGGDMWMGVNGCCGNDEYFGRSEGEILGVQGLEDGGVPAITVYGMGSENVTFGVRNTLKYYRYDLHVDWAYGEDEYPGGLILAETSTTTDLIGTSRSDKTSDGLPVRWTLSTQDPGHDLNENVPGKYYEFRIYDTTYNSSTDRVESTLVSRVYPVVENATGKGGLYNPATDEFIPFGGSSSGVKLGPVYGTATTYYLPGQPYADRDVFLTDTEAFSDRLLTTHYPAGSYPSADGRMLVVAADGSYEWIETSHEEIYGAVFDSSYMTVPIVINSGYSIVMDLSPDSPSNYSNVFGYAYSDADELYIGFHSDGTWWSDDADGHESSQGTYISGERGTYSVTNNGRAFPAMQVGWYNYDSDSYYKGVIHGFYYLDEFGNKLNDYVAVKKSDGTITFYDKISRQYLDVVGAPLTEAESPEGTPIVFNYVNGSASSTTYYLKSNKLYTDAEGTAAASAGTYVDSSDMYVVVSGGSYTKFAWTSDALSDSTTLYLCNNKAYSNPGLTAYKTAGTYADATGNFEYEISADGSYLKRAKSGDVELQYVGIPNNASAKFLTSAIGDKAVFTFEPTSATSAVSYGVTGFADTQFDAIWINFGTMNNTSGIKILNQYSVAGTYNYSSGDIVTIELQRESYGSGSVSISGNSPKVTATGIGNYSEQVDLRLDGEGPYAESFAGNYYSIKYYNASGTLTHNWIPVLRATDSKVCFKDTVTETYVEDANGATWVAGPTK